MTVSKLMYVVKDPGLDLSTPPAVPGLRRFAVDRPAPGVDTSAYPSLGHEPLAVASLWIEGAPAFPTASVYPAGTVDGYLVEERLKWNYVRDWPLGSLTPGMKQMSFLRRLPSIDHAEFASHWSDVHTGLAKKHHPTIWRYAQNVVLEVVTPDSPYLDGVAELSFRTVEDWSLRKYDSDDGRRIIAEDVAKFLDKSFWHLISNELLLVDNDG